MDRNEKRNALLTSLGEQAEALRSTEGWLAWLSVASKFHDYSLNNQLLILRQRPTATRVAGFKCWQAMGRQVRKGEKGIAILAPSIRKNEDPDPDTASTVLVGFRVVYVFDVSQTDGEPLPSLSMPEVNSADPAVFAHLLSVASSLEIAVESIDESPNGARGRWEATQRRITLVSSYGEASRTRTLLHELSHALDPSCAPGSTTCRADRELVAESAAYLVGSSLGLDMSEASTFYVASWGGDTATLKTLAGSVLKVAQALSDAIAQDAESRAA